MKAHFDFKITYEHKDEFTAIFNTDIKSFKDIGLSARENTYFTTMKMSTYLIAVLISSFHTEAKGVSDKGVGVRILGRQDWKDQTDFALSEAMSIVDSFS